MRRYHRAFKDSGLKYNISYASKAFTCIQMVKLVAEEDLQLDVVSEGELYTALEAGLNRIASISMVTIKRNMKLGML